MNNSVSAGAQQQQKAFPDRDEIQSISDEASPEAEVIVRPGPGYGGDLEEQGDAAAAEVFEEAGDPQESSSSYWDASSMAPLNAVSAVSFDNLNIPSTHKSPFVRKAES